MILLDVRMPGLDGFETAALIKQREKTRYVPIIFVTGVSSDTDQVFRGYSEGAVDYILKPYDRGVEVEGVGLHRAARAERPLAESEQRFRAACANAPSGMALSRRRRAPCSRSIGAPPRWSAARTPTSPVAAGTR